MSGYLLNPYIMKSGIYPTYGTGSSNGTKNAYTNQLYVSTNKVSSTKYTGGIDTARAGNCYNQLIDYTSSNLLNSNQRSGRAYVYSGTRTYSYAVSASSSQWIGAYILAGGSTTGVNVGNFKIVVGGTAYTAAQCISNNYIEPLVITNSSAWSTNYYWPNAHNVLTTTVGNANYPKMFIMFKPKVTTTGVNFYSNVNFNQTYDGLLIRQFPNLDISLTPFDYS